MPACAIAAARIEFFVLGFFVDIHVPLTYTFTNAICFLFKAFVKKHFRDVSGNA